MAEELDFTQPVADKTVIYDENNIRHLEDIEHIRLRYGMYIGRAGDGSHSDDGIYILIKEAIDNSIDEYRMGEGKQIEVTMADGKVRIRDNGRGIPLGTNKAGDDVMMMAVSKLNSGGKYDSKAFKKSVGLNGVGLKAVNALSWKFAVGAYRDGKCRRMEFKQGKLVSDSGVVDNTENEARGTFVEFEPDNTIFENYSFRKDFIEEQLQNYAYLNTGLAIIYNGKKISSRYGLKDLLNDRMTSDSLYPIIHFKNDDMEIALTHADQNNEEYYSFVNGQNTSLGGPHQAALREGIGKTIKEFFNKNLDLADIRNGIVAAIAINIEEPMFESQTKNKLSSKDMAPNGDSINKSVNDFIATELDKFLHINADVAETMLQKIKDSEKERKALAGVSKQAKERNKRVNLHNKKLRDCSVHFNDTKAPKGDVDTRDLTSIFITEGDSASGSITKIRDVNTQAVFSLRGKPKNSYGESKKLVYENEEMNLLQAALNIEDGLEGLRYNRVIIATDADVDGMHIRLLLLTFFLQFFPDLVKKGHVYILQTPLFRVRDKQRTFYCYDDAEREHAIKEIGKNAEITRFKGLGEISPEEFRDVIGKNIRLDQVQLRKEDDVANILSFYMGINTRERQELIIDNLQVEEDAPED